MKTAACKHRGPVLGLWLLSTFTPVCAADMTFTVWQDGMEAFVEYPPFKVGQASRLVTHLTLLDGNQPVREGRLTVILRREDGVEQRIQLDAPARAGIYLPELVPEHAGEYRLSLQLEHPTGLRRIDVPQVRVHPAGGIGSHADPEEQAHAQGADQHDHAADHGHEHGDEHAADHGHAPAPQPEHDGAAEHADQDEGHISFLKEQQWRMEFATALVVREPIARRLSLAAVVEAVPGRQAEVVAPSRGTLRPAADQPWPRPGLTVAAGQAIVELTSLAGAEDTVQLEADLQAAEARLRVARAELARVQGLVRDGVIPQRRLLEAEAEAATARGAHTAAAARHRETRGDSASRASGLVLRTPLAGVVTASHAAPGQVVEANTAIASVLDDRRAWIRVLVPAQDLALIDTPRDLRIRRPGSREWRELPDATLVYRGLALEQGALPLVYELDNTGDEAPRLPLGLPLIASLAAGVAEPQLTVAEEAVLDDDGVAVVMVMHGGEHFERRPVRRGVRAAGRVAILAGLEEHERVVTLGAYAVLLAGRDPGDSGHGHAH